MAARYVSSQVMKTVSNGSRAVIAEYVDKTTAWVRPSEYPSNELRETFAGVVEQNLNLYHDKTIRVAMKSPEHRSDEDLRMHYTVYELDDNGNVLATTHIIDKEKYKLKSNLSKEEGEDQSHRGER